ncbi:MAG: WD domain protein [Cirrosporium novae-zelandiae]|nr:MAG: WD domain protein [Cirrosporium novae-zelandiae]
MATIASPSDTPASSPRSPKRRRIAEPTYDQNLPPHTYDSPRDFGLQSDLEQASSPQHNDYLETNAVGLLPRDNGYLDRSGEDSQDERNGHRNHDGTFYRYGSRQGSSEPPSRVERDEYDPEMEESNVTPIQRPALDPTSSTKPEHLNYRPIWTLRGHKKGVSAIKYSPDGHWIASCSADASIRIWDAHTGQHTETFEGHLTGISAISWSPDSKMIASASDDKSIRLWDITTGRAHPVPFLGHSNYVYSLSFSPKGNMIASGSYDEAVFLWDVRSAHVLRSLPAHSDPVGGIDFIHDGTLVASCASDGLIRIWDPYTGQCLRTLVHEDNAPVTNVKFSPNGKYVLAWTLDSCVRLWNYVEGRCVKTYQGHKNVKYSIGGAFGRYGVCRDEAFAASGSEDGSIFLWDVSSKKILQKLEGHRDVVLGVDTHPTERSLVTGGLDRTVRIWKEEESGEQPHLNGVDIQQDHIHVDE